MPTSRASSARTHCAARASASVATSSAATPEIDALTEAAVAKFRELCAEVVDARLDPQFFERYGYLAGLGPDAPKTVAEWLRLYETEIAASAFPPERARPSQAILVLKEALAHPSAEPAHQAMVNETLPMLKREKRAWFERHGVDVIVTPYQPMFAEPWASWAGPATTGRSWATPMRASRRRTIAGHRRRRHRWRYRLSAASMRPATAGTAPARSRRRRRCR
jgi:Asp-tRNA(Asn)/Glu-tRNA(Gln) amidotransferase A subunit family amidase